MDFCYNAQGYPYALRYNGTVYYYITNSQGDVVHLVDGSGAVVASYEYDPYGNIVSSTGAMAEINPLRYRGYYYDSDTGFCYLQSRYYDPKICRFINADSYASTGQGVLGNNMFAYCNNSPIAFSDSMGSRAELTTVMLYEGGGQKYYPLPMDKYSKINGMINGQATFEHADESMGFGTYAKNGCGIIALYNAMQLLNNPQALGKIETEVLIMGGMLFGGLLGITPSSMGRYFAYNDIVYTGYSTYSALENDIYEGAVVVFLVMNNSNNIWEGFHYMTAQYTNGQYEIYNMYSDSSSTHCQSSLIPIYPGSVWICGYIVGG